MKNLNEYELSAIFDEEVYPFVVEQYSENDTVALNEAFNNWTDTLCKDDVISDEQYNTFCYVGKGA